MLPARLFTRVLIVVALASPYAVQAQRVTYLLNGSLEIADNVSLDVQPSACAHRVQVPGLAHAETPAFKKREISLCFALHEGGNAILRNVSRPHPRMA